MRKEKLDFKSIKAEAAKLADNEAVKKFVKGAQNNNETGLTFHKNEDFEKVVKLVVEGILKNRSEICEKPIQFYIKKDTMNWINKHAATGRGGQQIMLNFLIKKGIESVENEYLNKGIVFAKE